MELKDILKLENLNGIYKDNKGREWTVAEHSFNNISLKTYSEDGCSSYIEDFYPIETIVNLTFEQVLLPKNKVSSIPFLEEELEVLEAELTSLIDEYIERRRKIEGKRYQSLLSVRRRLWNNWKNKK